MAKLSSDGKYVTVQKGDTLWAIAKQYLGAGSKYTELVKANNIKNANRICIGQKIYLTKAASSSSSSSSGSTTKPANVVVVEQFGLLSTSDDTLYATWSWSKRNKGKTLMTDKYKIVWEYETVQGWFSGETSDKTVDEDYYEDSEWDEFKIPEGALKVRFKIKPISKTYEVEETVETKQVVENNGLISKAASGLASLFTGAKASTSSTQTTTEKVTKTVAYFDNIAWSSWSTYTVTQLFDDISAPSVTIDKDNNLTAVIEKVDIDAESGEVVYVTFEVVKNDKTKFKESTALKVDQYKRVSYSCKVDGGHKYKVRCKPSKKTKYTTLQGEWSDFSSNVQSMPTAPKSIKQCKANGKDGDNYSVYLEWDKVESADTYTIEYTTKKEYFDNIGGDVKSVSTNDNVTSIVIYGLSTGEYFFRINANIEEAKYSSDWTDIASVTIGEPPAAPTTWSSTTTAVVGEPLRLYWVHNSADGSTQTYANVELTIDGHKTAYLVENDGYYGIDVNGILYKIRDYEDDTEKDLTSCCEVDTSGFSEGVTIKWQVSTAGIVRTLGPLSTPREVEVYAKPTLNLMVTDEYEIDEDGTINLLPPEDGVMDVLESFPFYLSASAGPEDSNQIPVSYYVSIISNETYETVDALGNLKMVNSDSEVYSQYFDIKTSLLVDFSAANIDLENNVEYTIKCTVAMDSGLTAEQTAVFKVSWIENQYQPYADIALNLNNFSTTIRPYCEEVKDIIHTVKNESGKYYADTRLADDIEFNDVYTTTGDPVYIGKNTRGAVVYYCIAYMDSEGNPYDTPIYYQVSNSDQQYVTTSTKLNRKTIKNLTTETGEVITLGSTEEYGEGYYCTVEERILVEDITLSVYRRNFDGGFTLIADGIDNTNITSVTDPHPALDYARYRIVATAKSTGAVSFNDLPAFPIGCVSAIIQWDEEWSNYDGSNEDERAEPTWGGSILYLPFNIDVSDSNNSDVTHVRYVGRKRPVAYYGTQLGETSTWNMEVVKEDIDTIYALRRLQQWMGDVYVREPSGSGYWATVGVSFNLKHNALTVPVTLNITRVEGGI